MRNKYYKVRIMLLTFTFGLASVWFVNDFSSDLSTVEVELPKATSGKLIVVFPRYTSEIPFDGRNDGRSGGGHEFVEGYIRKDPFVK